MSEQFTPRPWRVREDMPICGREYMSRIVIDSATRHCMAFLEYETKDTETAREVRMNADLMAAAPLMYEEIEKQIAWLQFARQELAGKAPDALLMGFDQSVKYLSEAIAAANGRTKC